MAVDARQVEAFLEGQPVTDEVRAEIESQVDDPDSLVSVMARRIARTTRQFASGMSPLPALDPPQAKDQFEDLKALNREFSDLFRSKQWGQALDLRLRTCRLALRHLGPENRDTCTYINSLGRVLLEMREFERAARVLQTAVEMRSAYMGERHADTAISWTNLGRALEGVAEHEESRACHQLAVEITEATLGPNHPDTGVAMSELGLVSMTLRDFETARQCFDRAMNIAREIEGENDPIFGGALIHMGTVEEATGNLDQAERHYQLAHDVMLNAYGPYHQDVAWALNHIGSISLGRGQYLKAEKELALASDQLEQLEDKSFQQVSVKSNLGIAHYLLGDIQNAIVEYEAAIAFSKSLFGDSGDQTQFLLRNLVILLDSVRRRSQVTLGRSYFSESGKVAFAIELVAA